MKGELTGGARASPPLPKCELAGGAGESPTLQKNNDDDNYRRTD